MTLKTVAIGAALVLVSAAASAQQESKSWVNGNELKGDCHSDAGYLGNCLGFVTAVAGIVSSQPVFGWRACIPNRVTQGQLRDIMLKFLEDHPEWLHYPATSLAVEAFAEAFPCPK